MRELEKYHMNFGGPFQGEERPEAVYKAVEVDALLKALRGQLRAYESTIVMRGPIRFDCVQGADEPVKMPTEETLCKILDDLAALTLTWSAQRPKEVGWYWYRFTDQERDIDAMAIMRVIEHDDAGGLLAMNDDFYELVDDLEGSWAGPLVFPQEPGTREAGR